jgi:hypothetical protein
VVPARPVRLPPAGNADMEDEEPYEGGNE